MNFGSKQYIRNFNISNNKSINKKNVNSAGSVVNKIQFILQTNGTNGKNKI